MNEKQLNTAKRKIMAIAGMRPNPGSIVVFSEAHVRDTTQSHITFMSDGCVTDADNGNTFTAYMRSKGRFVDQRRPRSVSVLTEDLLREFL